MSLWNLKPTSILDSPTMAIELLPPARSLAAVTRPLCTTCCYHTTASHSSQRLQPTSIPNSTVRVTDYTHLTRTLPARRKVVIHDDLTPRNTHWLSIALSSFLPPTWTSPSTHSSPLALPSSPIPLPPAHHLVYFNPAYPSAQLLPDGTDPNQSPGPPFARRMWAGGSVRWAVGSPIVADGARWACVEGIRDVAVKGRPGEEKVFVGIERRFGRVAEGEGEDALGERLWEEREEVLGQSPLVERRNIVFLRDRTAQELEEVRRQGAAPPAAKMLKRTSSPCAVYPTPFGTIYQRQELFFGGESIPRDI